MSLFKIFSSLLLMCELCLAHSIEKPFLYEVKSQDRVLGHLFGTLHYGLSSSDLPEWFWQTFHSHQVYFFESTDNDKQHDETALKKIFYLQKGEKSLSQLLTKSEMKQLQSQLGLSKKSINRLSPSGAYQLLTYQKLKKIWSDKKASRHESSTPSLGRTFDDQLEQEVQKDKVARSLDSKVDGFYECVYTKNDEVFLKKIKNNLKKDVKTRDLDLKNGERIFRHAVEEYKKGRVDNRDEDEMDHESVFNEKCITTERNKIWASHLLSEFKRGQKIFVTVGLAHLVGKSPTLIELLEREGYSIRRIEKAP